MKEKPLIKYNDVSLNIEENTILKDVTFELKRNDFLYVIGRVGSGKSTLLKSIYAELPIEEGEAWVFDYDMSVLKRKNIPFLRRKIGIVFQDFQLLIDRSVEKNLEFVLRATGWENKKVIKDRINEVLMQVNMQNKAYKMPHELSGGEQQRIVIARALLYSPAVILADAPAGNPQAETVNQILELLHSISQKEAAVIMSTHNYSIVQNFPGKIMKCENMNLLDVHQSEIDEEIDNNSSFNLS